MTPVEKKILAAFRESLTAKVSISGMILFGSRARGDASPDSDMDVIVLVDGIVDRAVRRTVEDCAWSAGFEFGIIVSPVVIRSNEWNDGPMSSSLLFQAVRDEGIAV
ncbi:MAG: nucleotidyltransferase domain-containing protein [Planctomycetota bacterium]